MLRIVADLGNSRLKWARLDEEGRLTPSSALPPDDPLAWDALWDDWHQNQRQPSRWAIASVNPPVAQHLAAFLQGRRVRHATWYQTAADVPIDMDVEGADTGGADRALAVLAALAHMPPGQPGLVVSCGTAITIERVTAGGVWQGGVIAPGLFLCACACTCSPPSCRWSIPTSQRLPGAAAPCPRSRPASSGAPSAPSASSSPGKPSMAAKSPGSSGPAATPSGWRGQSVASKPGSFPTWC